MLHSCKLEDLVRIRHDKAMCKVCGFTGFIFAPKEDFWNVGTASFSQPEVDSG